MKHSTCPENKSVIMRGKIIKGCAVCLPRQANSEFVMQHKREWERKQYRQDITQAFETDFVKAQGADKAREMGWDEDSIRKWG